jgi:SAM-dependent methyltransferase
VYDGIPIIIDERSSVFSFQDFAESRNLFFDISKRGRMTSAVARFIPGLGGNNVAKKNCAHLKKILMQKNARPRVLVLGGSVAGDGIRPFLQSAEIHFVESDVSFGPRTQIVLDAHDIPYKDETFDCVIAQAVLEHVVDPYRCVEEIFRVLKSDGVIYFEIPFMQQVHGGAYDFVRFTKSGFRRLLKKFEEIESGTTAGPGTVLGWSYEYFLRSVVGGAGFMNLSMKLFARCTGFWMKYLDYLAFSKKHAEDAASGYYFIGRKSSRELSDKEIIQYYRA